MKKSSSQDLVLRDKFLVMRWIVAHKIASFIHLILSILAIIFVFLPKYHSLGVYINGCGLGSFLVFNTISVAWHKRRDNRMIQSALTNSKK